MLLSRTPVICEECHFITFMLIFSCLKTDKEKLFAKNNINYMK